MQRVVPVIGCVCHNGAELVMQSCVVNSFCFSTGAFPGSPQRTATASEVACGWWGFVVMPAVVCDTHLMLQVAGVPSLRSQ